MENTKIQRKEVKSQEIKGKQGLTIVENVIVYK